MRPMMPVSVVEAKQECPLASCALTSPEQAVAKEQGSEDLLSELVWRFAAFHHHPMSGLRDAIQEAVSHHCK